MTRPIEEWEAEFLADELSEAIRDAVWGAVLVFQNQNSEVVVESLSVSMGWIDNEEWREADFDIEVELESKANKAAKEQEDRDDS